MSDNLDLSIDFALLTCGNNTVGLILNWFSRNLFNYYWPLSLSFFLDNEIDVLDFLNCSYVLLVVYIFFFIFEFSYFILEILIVREVFLIRLFELSVWEFCLNVICGLRLFSFINVLYKKSFYFWIFLFVYLERKEFAIECDFLYVECVYIFLEDCETFLCVSICLIDFNFYLCLP